MPEHWADEVRAWQRLNKQKRVRGLPDGNTEYLLYQTLVGAWPIDEDRLVAYLEKAVRESKTHTSWTDPNEAYEEALRTFVSRCLSDSEFTGRVQALVEQLTPAWHATGLAQTLLKLTCPGVPDIYQGTELWDLSLVDPDNRRPVDFDLRRRLLERATLATAADVLAEPDEGLPKIWMIRRVLDLRRRRPELLGPSCSYTPIEAAGARADHVVAYARGSELVVVVPRLIARLDGDWRNTTLDLPQGSWEDEFSGRRLEGRSIPITDLFTEFPVAMLMPAAL
jgi:(1->4)-alpha-D-glucan 1-alpha-D-glucosylmutase